MPCFCPLVVVALRTERGVIQYRKTMMSYRWKIKVNPSETTIIFISSMPNETYNAYYISLTPNFVKMNENVIVAVSFSPFFENYEMPEKG